MLHTELNYLLFHPWKKTHICVNNTLILYYNTKAHLDQRIFFSALRYTFLNSLQIGVGAIYLVDLGQNQEEEQKLLYWDKGTYVKSSIFYENLTFVANRTHWKSKILKKSCIFCAIITKKWDNTKIWKSNFQVKISHYMQDFPSNAKEHIWLTNE